MLRFSSVNLNGIGGRSTHKLANLRHFLLTSKTPICFIQETKTNGLSIQFRTYFPESKFHVFYTNASQGCVILINKELLPEPFFDIEFEQSACTSSSQVLQKLTITNASDFTLRFSHMYCSPSYPIPSSFFDEINDFNPHVALGDSNVTTHTSEINTWLSSANCTLSENLVNFPTFLNHITNTLTTTPDAVHVQPSLTHTIDVIDSNVVPGDHTRIDCILNTPLISDFFHLPKTPPKKRTVYAFEKNAEKINATWNNFPATAKWDTLLNYLQKIKDIARESVQTATEFDDFQVHDTPEAANNEIDAHWRKFVEKCNGEYRLGEVWAFLRKFEKDEKHSPTVKITRNRSNNAYKETRKKCTISKPIQKDKALKVARILRRYKKLARKTDLKKAVFTRAELDAAVSGANKTSTPGVDHVTWKALPRPNHAAWDGILDAINSTIFKKDNINLPSLLKTARLIFVPKSSGKLRPISIIVTLAILVERMWQSRLDTLISKDPLLANRFGFIRKRSCEDVIGQIQTDIHAFKAEKLKVAMLSFDLRSAYDLVQHADLIIALDEFLRRNKAPRESCFLLLFAQEWLSNRQITFEGTSFSPTIGLAQGSPISCSFFVISMNFYTDSPSADVKINVYIFADDIQVTLAAKSLAILESALSGVVSDVESWCDTTSMHLSHEKCRVIWFGLDRPPKTAYVSPVPIKSTTTIKSLGVTFDSHLTFAAHVNTIIAHIKKYLPPLRYLVKLGLSDALARQFALSIRCKITYGLYWFYKLCDTRKALLERWWRNVLRATLRARKALPTSYLYLAAGLPTIANFNNYLLTKRAQFWHLKNVPSRPIPTIQFALENLPKTNNYKKTRPQTSQQSAESRYHKRTRESNSPTAALFKIVSDNRELFQKIVSTNKWQDMPVRRALKANSVKLYDLWDKPTRRAIFEKYTPVFLPTEASQNQTQTQPNQTLNLSSARVSSTLDSHGSVMNVLATRPRSVEP